MSLKEGNTILSIGNDDVAGTGNEPISLQGGNPALPLGNNINVATGDNPMRSHQETQALPTGRNAGVITGDKLTMKAGKLTVLHGKSSPLLLTDILFLNDFYPEPIIGAYDNTDEFHSFIADQTRATHILCIEMKNNLKHLIEKLVIPPAMQSNTPVDRMTFVDRYFPPLSAEAAFKAFRFEERVILSSATIYRNEKYQEIFNRLEAHELELTKELLSPEHAMFSTLEEHVRRVQMKISSNHHYQSLQVKLLQMRIKRRRLEAQVGAHQ
ncbi:hypothetical protein PGT21_000618 [Puccinia graminis f. sp. tritici]|uniref:Uncharacterized protein n=1 Tax=Puccinia graminis f. sp. tritici TaxID=56615 RepID=A0A5B0PR78_PUCGR|nr:hypothetical protein PGT21_000618 [Puccinia graminis f. sp. tritici]